MSKIYGADNTTAAAVDPRSHALHTTDYDRAGNRDAERHDLVQLLRDLLDETRMIRVGIELLLGEPLK